MNCRKYGITSRLPRTHRRRRALLGLTATLTLATTSACTSSVSVPDGSGTAVVAADTDGFHGTLVEPPLTPAPITLRDTSGQPVRLDQPLGGVTTVIFFGFTNCVDICPTTMADLAAARRSLPADTANKVSLQFITVDPQRDTRPVLRAWLAQFDADIVGLRGPAHRVHRAEESLYASRSARTSTTPQTHRDTHDYGVDHSSVVYMFGPDRISLIYTGGATPPQYAADLTRLLGG